MLPVARKAVYDLLLYTALFNKMLGYRFTVASQHKRIEAGAQGRNIQA